jgi:RNA polymerase sigma-70 factor (ECF subfamily)
MNDNILPEESDYELIKGYLAGDSASFDRLYERHHRQLYGYLCGLSTGNQSETDDLFQLTWLRVIEQLPRYNEQGYFKAWLFKISRNLLIDRLRRNRRRMFSLELDREDAPEIEAPPGREPWRELDERELGDLMDRAIKLLPPDQREVFLLRRENVTFKEIAEIQQCPLNTALARMQYALKNLRSQLGSIDHGKLR